MEQEKHNIEYSCYRCHRICQIPFKDLEQIQQSEEIQRYRKLMEQDEEIITLRQSVRKAAESKLSHGIIDVNDLVREINQENAARLQLSMHETEMLKQIYDYKYTTND